MPGRHIQIVRPMSAQTRCRGADGGGTLPSTSRVLNHSGAALDKVHSRRRNGCRVSRDNGVAGCCMSRLGVSAPSVRYARPRRWGAGITRVSGRDDFRPSVCSAGGRFFNTLLRSPAVAVCRLTAGEGEFQPVFVGDVARARPKGSRCLDRGSDLRARGRRSTLKEYELGAKETRRNRSCCRSRSVSRGAGRGARTVSEAV